MIFINLDNGSVLWYHIRMKYKSLYKKDELIKRWDDITSPARFAGANETLDWVYNASRTKDKVKLVKKPRAAYDPFATVFRGKIEEAKNGSQIRGVFTKGVFDYIITFFVAVVYFGVCAAYMSRVTDQTIPLLLISVGVIIILFALIPFPGKRKKYGALIRKVTGPSPDNNAAVPENASDVKTEKKEKYKFRMSGRKK